MIIDVCFQLACRSLNANEWFPLDMIVQESIWKNKLKNKQIWKYTLSKEDEFIHLVTRSMFDKKEFTIPYISRIEEIIQEINVDDVLEKFDLIFFKFSKILFNELSNQNYDHLYTKYIQFKGY